MLELDDLHRRFGNVIALDGMSFTVEAGKVVGFLGPNGAGKTSAMRAVLGVTALDSGSIRFAGATVDAQARRRFGYMPEERGLYPGMRGLEQLEYLGRLHGMEGAEARRSAQQQCERLGLGERTESKVEELSLGNQQRVQLAAALVHKPPVLFLDEPTSGLDPRSARLVKRVLDPAVAHVVAERKERRRLPQEPDQRSLCGEARLGCVGEQHDVAERVRELRRHRDRASGGCVEHGSERKRRAERRRRERCDEPVEPEPCVEREHTAAHEQHDRHIRAGIESEPERIGGRRRRNVPSLRLRRTCPHRGLAS